jgi:nicotinamidase-related amidase
MDMKEAREAFDKVAKNPAVVTIDLHRGHLDMDVATLPLPADAAAGVTERSVKLLAEYRKLGIPIIHVITSYRDRQEILANRYWKVQSEIPNSPRAAIAEHNLDHLPGLELMPGIEGEGDMIIDTKKRYDCFLGTDLEITLQTHGIDSLLVLGVNTNSCVLATSVAASVRDYAVFIVEDGVDTMLGPDLHEAAKKVLNASFGWFVDGETTLEALGARAAAA